MDTLDRGQEKLENFWAPLLIERNAWPSQLVDRLKICMISSNPTTRLTVEEKFPTKINKVHSQFHLSYSFPGAGQKL